MKTEEPRYGKDGDVLRLDPLGWESATDDDLRREGLGYTIRPRECDCGKEKHGFLDHVRGCPAGEE